MCSTLLPIRECKSKLPWDFYLTQVKTVAIRKINNSKGWCEVYTSGRSVHLSSLCGNQHAGFSKKRRNRSTICPTSLYYSWAQVNISQTFGHQLFTAVPLTIAKLQNQCRCLATEEWIRKTWDMFIVEFSPSHKEEWNYVVCRKVDEAADNHISQTKAASKRQMNVFSFVVFRFLYRYLKPCMYIKWTWERNWLGDKGDKWEGRRNIVGGCANIHISNII